MRIAVNGWFWDQLATGSGQYLAALMTALAAGAPHHEWVLVVPDGRAGAQTPSGWRVTIVRTPFDRLSANLAKLWFEQVGFPAECRRLGAQAAWVPYWGAPWWRPCPVAVTVHDLIPLLLPLYRGGPLQRAYTRLVCATARRAAAVLTDSEASRRDIIARLGIPSPRVHAIPLAAGDAYRPVTDGPALAAARVRYGLPAGPFLLYLGGFDARKNLPRTLEAYARAVARAGDAVPPLVVAGTLPSVDSSFAPDPRPIAVRLGLADRVHFTGWVDEADKPALYTLATGVLFASEYEGFGLPVLEAMACDG